ncbi:MULTISPECIES: conjugative transposon protein TraK [Chryseobacterium]|uniref:Bacteroides conjugative transposon TraK protein n=2 Tax=Chryseobacterium gleum TaxID=250 RepID=A0A448B097_CHRGE|nr:MULTISPECIES: conjugative transposon protein TraK [Chryseobacterium]ASE61692.1 conjugative transposon protein TraK [Chryseobacterium indologenes]AZB32256.1 conjugative transposon protein TraK [Chryseobacterium bernardetii]EFK33841.1 conjugative transposon TraK protein [Chryseobacterium gleum ATCC 35910]MDG4650864.1 conjugative transposon protein TraK [Chryseobacterium arthrosphaerae]QQY34580.1 conjugative transposon protein TraK [Chryseobacterium gleum]
MLIKNIEHRIKINKIVSLSAIGFAVFVVIAGFFFSYRMIQDSRKSIYVLDNGVPVLAKQTDVLLNRPVEYKAQIELFHRLFFTLAPDDAYIKENIQKSLYLIDDSGKKEYTNLREKGFYNQIVASSSMVSIHADSIHLSMEQNKFQFFGKQMITRKSSVITRKLITEGFFEDIIRSPNNPHGVLLKNWRIIDNEEISNQTKNSY